MNGGDDIYIRGGTYNENVLLPHDGSKDGTADNYSSIQSYPGEWAIINGGHNAAYVLGYTETGSLGANDTAYWRFERLEITGGCSGSTSEQCYGIGVNGGPFIVRYCYIHDNYCADSGESPAGVGGYCWRDSKIEYNHFYNNGDYGGDNGGDIVIYSDYRPADDDFNSGSYAGYYYARNEIKYNLFSGGDGSSHGGNIGIRQKGIQDMIDGDYSDMTYKDWGDDIHHNIFIDYAHSGVQIWQDFAQVFKNIFDQCPIFVKSYSSGPNKPQAHVVIYNNTVSGSHIKEYAGGSETSWTVYTYLMNNIVENFGLDNDHYSTSIHFGAHMDGNASVVTIPSATTINHNYLYRPQIDDTWLVGGWSNDTYRQTTSEFDSQYSRSNYQKASSEGTDNLFKGTTGADKYITRGEHVVSGSTTIANGGGSSHPYLTNVDIPTYIGATNPDDNGWVDGVLNDLSNTDWLKSLTEDRDSNDDPVWIEGHTSHRSKHYYSGQANFR